MDQYGMAHDLGLFMQHAQEQMAKDYERFTSRSKEDPGTAGTQGEGSWALLLKRWLPSTFHIRTQCRILGEDGRASRQADVVILRPEYPDGLLEEKYVLAAGVLAAFECKLTLRNRDIEQFFKRALSMKERVPERIGDPYIELQRPIVVGLLAHSYEHNDPEKDVDHIGDCLMAQDQKYISHPNQMPDLCCIADLATWSAMKTTWGPFHPMGDSPSEFLNVQTSYVLHRKAIRSFTPVGAMLSSLWTKLACEYKSMDSMAYYFLAADLTGVAIGKQNRTWTKDVFSFDVVESLKQGALNTDLGSRWCTATVR